MSEVLIKKHCDAEHCDVQVSNNLIRVIRYNKWEHFIIKLLVHVYKTISDRFRLNP